jgi:hypothetical protein
MKIDIIGTCPKFQLSPAGTLVIYGLLMASIIASIVISKFFHNTLLITTIAESFFLQNFNLIWTRIQCGQESLMLFHCCAGFAGMPFKNVMPSIKIKDVVLLNCVMVAFIDKLDLA